MQECVLALQAELTKRGHHAVILTPQSKEARSRQMDGVIFLGGGTEVKNPFHTTSQVSASVNPEALQKVLDQERFDVLHFHEPWVPVLSRQLLTRSKCANVATFHAKLPDSVMSRTIEKVVTPYTKSIMKYLDALTAVSEPAAEYTRTLTNKTITIVPNGIDLAKYRDHKKTANKQKKILYIGRLERRKGIIYLINAFAKLQENDKSTQLLIAGDGPDRQKLELVVNEQKINNVKFLGFISEAQKLKLLSEVDLFCSPALFGESFGIVLLEAMASGTVTIAGNNPGYTALMKNRGVLSIVNPKDKYEFARRFELLLHDQTLRSAWQEWAEQYIEQFNYSHVVDQYEVVYKAALKQK